LAKSAEAAIAELSADKIAEMPPEEQFKYLLAEVKKAAGLREMAQACARDAASYVNPRLSSTAVKVHHGGTNRHHQRIATARQMYCSSEWMRRRA
jgi:hypothetical protein